MIADLAILTLPKVPLSAKQLLPEYSGIYYVLDETHKIWYIGQAKNIQKRWQGKAHHRIYQLEAQKKTHFTIYYEQVSESQLDSVENARIEKYHPHLNYSPVKHQKVRPTETLLRETLSAIADFAFILGVEPATGVSSCGFGHFMPKNVKKIRGLGLSVIHICMDLDVFNERFQPELKGEKRALLKKIFKSRKNYASKWEICGDPFICRLCVNGYIITVSFWSIDSYGFGFRKNQFQGLAEYIQTTLVEESIRALKPESLEILKQQPFEEGSFDHVIKRLNPYTEDLIKLLFKEPVERESVKKELEKVSEDYKAGRRGIGSRSRAIQSQPISSEFMTIDDLLNSRGIDINKYSTEEILGWIRDKMGVYIQCFCTDLKEPYGYTTHGVQKFPSYNYAQGIIDNEQVNTASCKFDTVYLLAGVEKKVWLLVEEYLKDFVQPAGKLSNGEGFVRRFYISAKKFIVPAKVNIKLENIGYSAWIPFGSCKEFPTYDSATAEIRRRLKDSELLGLKLGFKRETIEK